jgi:hypothetical protein
MKQEIHQQSDYSTQNLYRLNRSSNRHRKEEIKKNSKLTQIGLRVIVSDLYSGDVHSNIIQDIKSPD